MSLSIRSLALMPMSDPRVSLKKDALQCKYTPQSYTNIYTYTNALWEPTATSAVIPPDFRCLTGRRQGGWGQQAVNTGRDRKSLRTLPLWIFDEREWGLAGAFPLVKSEQGVCSECMTANRGWDKQGLDWAQTTANPAVVNICCCN